jgi:hypothetical protein
MVISILRDRCDMGTLKSPQPRCDPRLILRIAIPSALIVGGILALVGCIPLPFPERSADPAQKDIRTMFGDSSSKRAFRTSKSTRAEIISALGPPPYASQDEKSIAYTFNMYNGLLIVPLCFTATANGSSVYAVRLDFDDSGVLVGWKPARHESSGSWWRGWIMYSGRRGAIDDLNKEGPKLENRQARKLGNIP